MCKVEITLPLAVGKTTSATGHRSQTLDGILAVRLSRAFDCLAGSGLSYYCRVTSEVKAGSTGEQPSDGLGADRNCPVSATRRLPSRHLLNHRVDPPIPQKPTRAIPGHGAMVQWRSALHQVRWLEVEPLQYRGARPGPSTADTAPRVVKWSLPRHVPSLLVRQVGGLLRP